jgi:hypothetical protein
MSISGSNVTSLPSFTAIERCRPTATREELLISLLGFLFGVWLFLHWRISSRVGVEEDTVQPTTN